MLDSTSGHRKDKMLGPHLSAPPCPPELVSQNMTVRTPPTYFCTSEKLGRRRQWDHCAARMQRDSNRKFEFVLFKRVPVLTTLTHHSHSTKASQHATAKQMQQVPTRHRSEIKHGTKCVPLRLRSAGHTQDTHPHNRQLRHPPRLQILDGRTRCITSIFLLAINHSNVVWRPKRANILTTILRSSADGRWDPRSQ